MKDLLYFLGFVLIFVGIIFTFSLSMAYLLGRFQCEQRLQTMSREGVFRLVAGCFVQTENGLVPLESFRVVE